MPMKKPPRYWIEYAEDWRDEPMAYWVHKEKEATTWRDSKEYDPPAPKLEGKKGFRILCVEFSDMVFRFSSRAQIDECVRVLQMKPLISSARLTILRGSKAGPNSNWLSRLPAHVKAPKNRELVVEKLLKVAHEIGI
jgi:hypothetical protein